MSLINVSFFVAGEASTRRRTCNEMGALTIPSGSASHSRLSTTYHKRSNTHRLSLAGWFLK